MKKQQLQWLTTPRIIGIIMLVIATTMQFMNKTGVTMIGIVGLILLLAPKKTAQKEFDRFTSSFSDVKTVVICALYDALFMMSFLGAGFLYLWAFNQKAIQIQGEADFSKLAALQPGQAGVNTIAIKEFLAFFFIGLALVALVSLAVYAASRMMMWTTIAKQKQSKKAFFGYLKLTTLWWLLWSPIIVFLAFVVNQEPVARPLMVIAFVLVMYFTQITYPLYTKTKKAGYSIGHGIGFGISKIPKLIIPAAYAFVAYVVVYQALSFTQYLPQTVWPVFNMVFVMLYLAWARNYIYPIVTAFKD